MKRLFLFGITLLLALPVLALDIAYELKMSEPHTHYFEVRMEVSGNSAAELNLKMPVWTPGSYLVREFARHVEGVRAIDNNGKELNIVKTNKNTWQVQAEGAETVIVNYSVYAYELSVRTSYLDASHGYVNGTSIFFYVDGSLNTPVELTVKPYKAWSRVSTGLTLKSSNNNSFVYSAPNYDVFADAPIEIGNHDVVSFEASGVEHRIALYGPGNYDTEALKKDLATVVEGCTDVFGENPNKSYLFIVHNVANGGGGLEHLNSTTLLVNRWTYQPRKSYVNFLSLATHEYFHLWNVKRVRPAELGPFNYNEENYTRLLWVMEGFTSYYDEYLLVGMGFMNHADYLKRLGGSINRVENQPGNKVQPVSEASFDAWIKFYRPNENSFNTTVSYYSKGSVLAALLDLEILNASEGKKNLNNVMQVLYNRYYKEQGRGFSDREFQDVVEEVAGQNMDQFFGDYVYGTATPNYDRFLGYVGLKLESNNNSGDAPSLGASFTSSMKVRRVNRGSSAYSGGLNVDDELLAVNSFRVNSVAEVSKMLSSKKVGEKVSLLISRDGMLTTIELMLLPNNRITYSIGKVEKPSKAQSALYKAWLGEEE